MKVKQLIGELTLLDPELDLYLQRDSEGNGYESVRGIDIGYIHPHDPDYDITVMTDEDVGDALEEDEDLSKTDFRTVAVIYP